MPLWKHQQLAVERAREAQSLAIFYEIGTGKTLTAIEILREDFNSHKRIRPTLIFTKLTVCQQWKEEILKFSKLRDDQILVMVGSGTSRVKAMQQSKSVPKIVITNYEGVRIDKFYYELLDFKPEIVVLDECFAAHTPVDTPDGPKRIDKIAVGDTVYSAVGPSRVLAVMKRPQIQHVRVHAEDKEITVSLNHPFFTQRGWVCAQELTSEDTLVYQDIAMRVLSEDISEKDVPELGGSLQVLRAVLRNECTRAWRSTPRISSGKQSNEEGQCAEEGFDNPQSNRARPECSWWKRLWSHGAGETTLRTAWRRMGATARRLFGEAPRRLPHMLQTGFGEPSAENWRGMRRGIPQNDVAPGTGQEERRSLIGLRVDRVSFHECRDLNGPTEVSFYDLTIEGHPSFSVYGCLVHNSHCVKDASSAQAKKIYPLCDKAERKFLLTGTPMPNSMLDLYGQYRALDPKIFGHNFFAFRSRYFYDKNAGMPAQRHFPDWQPYPHAAEQLGKILSSTSVQAKKSECLDLPPLLRPKILVPMSAAQERAYKQMEKTFIAELEDGSVSMAEFAMTKTIRLQQIMCGFAVIDDPENNAEAQWFSEVPRLDAYKDRLESLAGERVIVWTTFAPTYKKLGDIAEKLGRKVGFLTGQQSQVVKQEYINAFRAGEIDTLIAHPRAGGVGVNLTESAYAIYYNRGYSLTDFEQSEGRNYRGGSDQHEKITHFHLVAAGTLDDVIAEALLNKQKAAEKILAWARTLS